MLSTTWRAIFDGKFVLQSETWDLPPIPEYAVRARPPEPSLGLGALLTKGMMAFFDPIFLHTALFPNSPHSWPPCPWAFSCFLVWHDHPSPWSSPFRQPFLNP